MVVELKEGTGSPFSGPWLPVFRGTSTADRPGPRLEHMFGPFGCLDLCTIHLLSIFRVSAGSVGDGRDSDHKIIKTAVHCPTA